MNFWIAGLCLSALLASVFLVMRQQLSASQRAIALLLQLGIWSIAWALYQPPQLLPAATRATLDTTSGQLHASTLPDNLRALESLEITGDGLPRQALSTLPGVRLRLGTQSPAPQWQIHWPRQLQIGESLQLQVSPGEGLHGPVQLTLLDPFGTEVDRTQIAAEWDGEKPRETKKKPGSDSGPFLLADQPKLPGRWLYQLQIEHEGELRRESVPVVVHDSAQPRVLLWLGRPSFETAALSRWLRQSGTEGLIITQLAPKILRRVTINSGERPSKNPQQDPLHSERPFDLVILDSHLWPQLTPAQKQRLATLAQERALLWLVDDASPREFLAYARAQGMPLRRAEARAVDNPLRADGELPALTTARFQPAATEFNDTLLGPAPERRIFWARTNPRGSLGFVLFNNSYRWITAGFSAEFARLWQSLFQHQLAFAGGAQSISLQPELPVAERRVTLCSSGFGTAAPKLVAADSAITDPVLQAVETRAAAPGRCFAYWPRQAGWHQLQTGSSVYSFYVFSPQDWPWWQRNLVRVDTAQMARARLGPAPNAAPPKLPLPLPWIAALLMVLLGISWWRERSTLR